MASEVERKLDEVKDSIHAVDKSTSELKVRFEQHLASDEKDMAEMSANLKEINGHLSQYNELLTVHIRGTEINAENLKLMQAQTKMMQEDFTKKHDDLSGRLKPLEDNALKSEGRRALLKLPDSFYLGLITLASVGLHWLVQHFHP